MNVAALTSRVQRSALHPLFPAAAILALGIATIGGALAFQYIGGLKPCPLCYEQRTPWYILIGVSVAILGAERLKAPRAAVLALYAIAALLAVWSVYLGGFHAGVEYKWWPGPPDCTGEVIQLPTDGGVFGGLSPGEIVRCDEVAWALYGVSLAGFNFLFSLVAAALASLGVRGAVKEER